MADARSNQTGSSPAEDAALGDVRLENVLYAIQLGQGIGTLRFLPSLELEFRREHAERSLTRMRTGFMVATGLYLAFLVLRLLVETGPAAAWGLGLRTMIIGAMVACVLASYTALRSRMTPLVMLTYLVFGAGVTAIEIVGHHFNTDRRYEGLIFISIHCYVFGGLLFRQACATTAAIYLTFALGGWLGGLVGKQWGYELFFLLLVNVLGAVALYLLEYSDRENFLRRHIIREMAIRDGLTGLFNRSAFMEHFERVLRQAIREQQPLGLAIFDLDAFKQYNDGYGHLAGDECLRTVTQALGGAARRPLDMVARYGGEEFMALWYGAPTDTVRELAEGIRRTVERLGIPHDNSPAGRVTVSVGAIGLVPLAGQSTAALMKQADEALYEAKAAGRNRAVVRVREPEAQPLPAVA